MAFLRDLVIAIENHRVQIVRPYALVRNQLLEFSGGLRVYKGQIIP